MFSFHCSVIEIDASQRPVYLPESGARRPKAVVPLIAVSRRLVNAAARRIQLCWFARLVAAWLCTLAAHAGFVNGDTSNGSSLDDTSAPIFRASDGHLVVNGFGTLVGSPNDPYLFAGFSSGSYYVGLSGGITYNGGTIFVNGALTVFLADAGTASTLNGAIRGTGSLIKDGLGTLTLTGKNTFTGGTVLSAGTLTVNGPQALGLGNVVLNGGILNADPRPINVKGNYTQNAGATLQLEVAGSNPGQYDTLNVGGNAALGGTLQLISLGFQPKGGNQLTLVSTGGVVSSRFAKFVNPFATGPGFNTIDLVYARQSVTLEFLTLKTPVVPLPPAYRAHLVNRQL